MTYEQYWNQDCLLAKYYREAEKINMERLNEKMWLQGMYIYDAMARLSPLFHAFSNKKVRAQPYPDKPYPISKNTEKEVENTKEKQTHDKAMKYMEAYMIGHNKRFKEKGLKDVNDN